MGSVGAEGAPEGAPEAPSTPSEGAVRGGPFFLGLEETKKALAPQTPHPPHHPHLSTPTHLTLTLLSH